MLRKQAHHAVLLYFEQVSQAEKKTGHNEAEEQKGTGEQISRTRRELFSQENKELEYISTVTHEPGISKNEVVQSGETDWTAMYSGLENAIKIRHYSPSTLRTYIGWTRKFQTYTGSKDSRLLTVEDDGKGKKDRTVPIPDALTGALKAQLNRIIEQHECDCRAGYDGVLKALP